ncbi:hypothetical protein [Aquibacillus salsiterrae]|uniref:Uncharacterized protein n=1 Tax=Aquibacillus salsiterrae TaxID=2950439 RepID=A0A9X3WF35_9BACI|nr:hypothetical protein [Aquibacillus salsiterrae]MDC3418647.1 hypothetical protein [Aquibacillus salsiterrae]
MLKKKLFNLSTFLILTLAFFSVNPISSLAADQSDCSSDGVRCQEVEMFQGEKSASTNSIYVSKGSYIYWGASTYDDSQFQVGAYLYDPDLNLIGEIGVAGSGGIDWDQIRAEQSGDYFVVLKSGDSSQGRSHAYAYLETYY